jgi:hypothetical protein
MRTSTKTSLLRLPQKLSFTALGVAALGTIACSSQSSTTADAAVDSLEDTQVADAPMDSTQPGDVTPASDSLADSTQDSSGDSTTDVALDEANDVQTDVFPVEECVTLICIPSGTVDGAVCPTNPGCDPNACPVDAGCQIEAV